MIMLTLIHVLQTPAQAFRMGELLRSTAETVVFESARQALSVSSFALGLELPLTLTCRS